MLEEPLRSPEARDPTGPSSWPAFVKRVFLVVLAVSLWAAMIVPVLVMIAFGLSLYLVGPPLTVSSLGEGSVIIDLQTFGEYGTKITGIEIEDLGSGKSVWRIEASPDGCVLWTFVLQEGENRSDLLEDQACQPKWPISADSFNLLPDRRYRITVQGYNGMGGDADSSAKFSFDKANQ